METKEIIGLDLGLKRTGIARASTTARLPEPLFSVQTDEVLPTIENFADGKSMEAIVVGLPRSLSGNDTEQTAWVRDWVDKAKKKLPATFYWQDEALTTHQAGLSANSYKTKDVDAISAAIILQDFLDTPPEKRVIC